MKNNLNLLYSKINALELRERKIIALSVCTCVIALFMMLAWQPLWLQYQELNSKNQNISQNINASKNSINELTSRSQEDINLPYQQKLATLKETLNGQKNKIDGITSTLIQPEKMNLVFNGLLTNNALIVDSIKNLQPEIIEIKGNQDANQILYKHGLLINMRGTYLDSLAYIKTIESQEWQLYWDEMAFETQRYPKGVLRLKVHTMSTSNKVLGL